MTDFMSVNRDFVVRFNTTPAMVAPVRNRTKPATSAASDKAAPRASMTSTTDDPVVRATSHADASEVEEMPS